MVDARRLKAGYCSETDRANAVRQYFEDSVDTAKLSINDTPGNQRADGVGVVAVQEGNGADFTRDEFGSFRSKANKLVNSLETARYATRDDKCLILGYAAVDRIMTNPENPAEAGKQLADPSKMTDLDVADMERYSVFHNGENEYTVYDREGNSLYAVRMAGIETEVMAVLSQDSLQDGDKKQAIVGAVVTAGPEHRNGPDHYTTLEVNQTGGGGAAAPASGGDSSSAADDSDDEKEAFVSKGGGDEAIDELTGWIEAYTAVKSNLDPSGVSYDFGEATIPEGWDSDYAGQTVEGVKIETAEPWGTEYHDGDGWTDKEGWQAHQTALREIMQNEDEVLYFGADYGYFNFVPKAAIEEVTN